MVKNLKKLRIRREISQQQLADVIGVSQQSINKYENHGVEPDIETLTRLADFFETTVDELIGHASIERMEYNLNDAEAHLIDSYRRLNPEEKEIIRLVLKNHRS